MIAAAFLAALSLQAADPTLAELERAYDQTCNDRIYGQFDDLCNDMLQRVKAYRRELKAKPPRKAAPAPSPPASAPPAPPLAPPPSHEPLAPAPPKGSSSLARSDGEVARSAGGAAR